MLKTEGEEWLRKPGNFFNSIISLTIMSNISKTIPFFFSAVVCLICFLVGLIFTTGAGEYWLSLFDSFAGTVGLVVVAMMEMIAVIYVYGHQKFTNDIFEMTGVKPGIYWQVTWRYLAPVIMCIILTSSIVSMCINHPEYQAWSKEEVCQWRSFEICF